MNKYILVPYELKGKEGKIIVKEGIPIENIKEYCVIDRLEQINKDNLAKQVVFKEEENKL